MKCWMSSCWRDTVGESRFCAVHGWNQTGSDHVPLAIAPGVGPLTKPQWTRESIVEALQRWAAEHGRQPTQEDWHIAGVDYPRARLVAARFGTWSAGLAAAGMRARRGPRRRLDVPA